MIVTTSRIAVCLVPFFMLSVASAAVGIDELYVKPDSEKSWGQLASDLVGYGGYQKSYALVVGISQYTAGYKSLKTENDALRMRDYLIHEAGFDYVRVVTEDEVTPNRIRTIMLNEFRNLVDSDDRFIFYWSGHGIDVKNAIGQIDGYLPVANSPRGEIDKMISMADIRGWDQNIHAEQTLYLLDTCFSGLAVQSKSPPPTIDPNKAREYNIAQLAKPSRHLISAGTAKEEAIADSRWNGSLFTWALLKGLRGAADTQSVYPRDGIVSLGELISYLKTTIEIERKAASWPDNITPQLQDLRSNEGEFFFFTSQNKIDHIEVNGGQPTGKFMFGRAIAKNAETNATNSDVLNNENPVAVQPPPVSKGAVCKEVTFFDYSVFPVTTDKSIICNE